MNSAAQALAGRKWQGIEFKIGVSKAFVPNGRTQRVTSQNYAKRRETERKENARVAIAEVIGDDPEQDRKRNQVDECRGNPSGDEALVVLAFRATRSPVGAPQPWRKRVRFLERGQLLEKRVSLRCPEDKPAAEEDEERGERDADDQVSSLKILARNKLSVDKEEAPSEKRQR